jgi:hypothetical protein
MAVAEIEQHLWTRKDTVSPLARPEAVIPVSELMP